VPLSQRATRRDAFFSGEWLCLKMGDSLDSSNGQLNGEENGGAFGGTLF